MKYRFILIVVTLLLFIRVLPRAVSAGQLPSDYADAGCISLNAQQEIVRTFGIQVKTFPKFDVRCDVRSPLFQILIAIDVMKRLRFSGAPISPLDRGILDTDYFGFFSKRVKEIRFADTNYGEKTGTGAHFSSGTMTLYRGFGDLPLPYLMSLLIHEARHAEGFFHVKCTQGRKIGMAKMCDSSFADGGAYAVQIEMLMRMATRGLGLSSAFKSAARLGALAEAMHSINESPLREIEALALVNRGTGMLEFIEKGERVATHTRVTAFKRLLYHPLNGFLYTTGAKPQILDPYTDLSPASITSLGLHRKLMLFAQDPHLIDVQPLGLDFVTLFESRLVWGAALSEKFSKADRIQTRTTRGQEGAFLLRNGSLLEIQKKGRSLELRETAVHWPDDLLKVISYDNQQLALLRSGELVYQSGGSRAPYKPTRGMRYSDVVNMKFFRGL